jgi:segregation and condensation protein B
MNYSMSSSYSIKPSDEDNLKLLEALLFAAPGLSTLDQLATTLQISKKETDRLLQLLCSHYSEEHGIRVQKVKDQYQLVSAGEYAEKIESFLGLEMTTRLTQAALEALAIIAYKQPTTRPEIDAIRGVNSETVVKSLLSKGLIEEIGRSDAPGRPILYGVTPDFLQHFGLESLEQLPEIDLELIQPEEESETKEGQRILKD